MNLDTHTVVLVKFLLYSTRSVVRRKVDTNLRKTRSASSSKHRNKGPRTFVYLRLHTVVALRRRPCRGEVSQAASEGG